MLIKDINLKKEDIRNILEKYNENYNEYILRKNILLRATSRCESMSDETLI